MPALLERPLAPPAPDITSVGDDAAVRESRVPPAPEHDAESPSSVTRICSACYLSESELNRTGLLGCPRCYETFAPVIAAAAEVLHGVRVPNEWVQPKPRRAVTNPWPTRRAVRLEPR